MARRRIRIYREVARTLRIADPLRCRIAVVADTHARPHPALYERLAAERPDAILHAGDIGDLAIIDALDAIAPAVVVRGNIDDRGVGLPDGVALTIAGADGPRLVLYLTHVGVQRVRLQTDTRLRAEAADAALVVCGHSHVPLIVRDGRLAVFNPGSCGPRRFGLPIVFGMIDIGVDGVRMRHVDCETGQVWKPPPPSPRK